MASEVHLQYMDKIYQQHTLLATSSALSSTMGVALTVLIAVALFTMATPAPVLAITTIDDTSSPEKGGFLLMGESQQWISLMTDFTVHSANTDNSGSRNSKYDALYHITKPFALVDPHLLKLNMSADLKGEFDRNSSDTGTSSAGGNYGYQYNISGAAFDRKWYPVTFHASNVTETIMPLMAPSYDSKVSTMGAAVALTGSQFCGPDGKLVIKRDEKAYWIRVQENMIRAANLRCTEFSSADTFREVPSLNSGSMNLVSSVSSSFMDYELMTHYNDVISVLVPPYAGYGTGPDILSAGICGLYARLGWEQNTQETTGGTNYQAKNNNYQLYMSHNFRDISASTLDLTYTAQDSLSSASATSATPGTSESSTTSQHNNGLSLNFRNNLKDGEITALESTFVLQDTTTSGIPLTNITLDEIFTRNITPAMTLNLNYDFSYNSTKGVGGGDQTSESHAVSSELQGRAGAFTSRLRGRYGLSDFLGGSENRYAVLTGIGYRKDLSLSSQLTFDVSGEHEVADRRATPTEMIVRDELHARVHQSDIMYLNNFQPILAVTRVMSKAPDIIYQEGVDYSVDLASGRVSVLPIGRIDPDGGGMDLFISYSVPVNSSAKYSNDTVTFNSGLSLLSGKLNLAGSFTLQNQSLISGQPTGLYNTRIGDVRMLYTVLPGHTASFEYRYNSTGPTAYQYVEGDLQNKFQFSQAGLNLGIKDRYTINAAVGAVPSNTENTLTASAAYNQLITEHIQGTVSANLVDDRHEGITGDFAFFKAGIVWQLNKLQVNVTGQTSWRLNNQGNSKATTRDDYIHVELTRHF